MFTSCRKFGTSAETVAEKQYNNNSRSTHAYITLDTTSIHDMLSTYLIKEGPQWLSSAALVYSSFLDLL